MYLVKTFPNWFNWQWSDASGNTRTISVYSDSIQWNKTYGGPQNDKAKCLIQIGDNTYVLAGYTESYGAGDADMYLVKTDPSGNQIFNKTYGGSQDDEANCIVQAHDGGFVLAGYTKSEVLSPSTWVVKVDSYGNLEWNRTYAGKNATSLIRTSDGGCALSVEELNAFELVKIDSSGQVQWNQVYPGPSFGATAESLVQTYDSGYALAGWTLANDTTSYSGWLIKTDSAGHVQWNQTFPGHGLYSVIQTVNNGFAMTGDYACLLITIQAVAYNGAVNMI
jgi:hypothetical protein